MDSPAPMKGRYPAEDVNYPVDDFVPLLTFWQVGEPGR